MAPASGGPDPGTPAFGTAVAGGVLVNYVGPEGATKQYSFGAASAGAIAYGTASPLPEASFDLGGPTTGATGITNTGAFSVNPAPVAAPPPPRVSPAARQQAALVRSGASLPGRRGLGAWALLTGLGAVMLATGGLGYARWQLLDWLPAREG